MSYILDALRRADAERQQGQLPGLHAQVDSRALPTPPRVRRPLAWAGAAMALALLAAALGWWYKTAPSQPLVQPTVQAQPSAAAPELAPPLPAVAAPTASPAPLPIVVSAPAAAPVILAPTQAVAAPSTPAAAKPLPLHQLAGDLRRQLPPLVVGGSVWSDSVASRFIILDGLMLREGDTVAPGLVLERIQPRSAVLRWRDKLLELAL